MNLLERAAGVAPFEALFGDEALLAAMLRFEVALARAQARNGLIAQAHAEAIAAAARDFTVDTHILTEAGAHAGSLAIPFVQALRGRVTAVAPAAADVLHQGSTSQDVLDTAVALCTRDAVAALLQHADAAIAAATALARMHRDAAMLARTLMQAAGITTFGFKAAQWSIALRRCRQRIAATADNAVAVSLGGASGNLAALGERGVAVRAALAVELGLRDPRGTWHTLRHDWVALACDVALLCGTLAKIAQDIALLAQSEVAEVSEPAAEGRGGSSAMPHKRNPVLSLRVLTLTQPVPGWIANLLAALPQPHERALGAWQSELAQWPAVFRHACGSAQAMAELLAGLEIYPDVCRRNIDALQEVVFAEQAAQCLAPALGKAQAQALVSRLSEQALRDHRPLGALVRAALDADTRAAGVDREVLARCFDPALAAGVAAGQVDSLLAAGVL